MTEDEWFAAIVPDQPLSWSRTLRSDRKLRLFAVACCRRAAHLCSTPRFHEIVDEAEVLAERQTNESRDRLKRWRHVIWNEHIWKRTTEGRMAHGIVSETGGTSAVVVPNLASLLIANSGTSRSSEQRFQVELLRDIVGNPFRPVSFSRKWRTDTVLLLARTMYESREFSAMPILADALQDTGCDNDDILAHCRDPHATHVRGCWVVDLVLGKA